MTKIYLIVVALLATFVSQGQMLTPTVISSTGGFSSNANGSLSYTVGEMTMVQTFSANGNILTQGFQQPTDTNFLGLLDLTQDEFGSFVVYPNPAVDYTSFGFQFPEQGKVSVVLYNELGQKLADVYHTTYDVNAKTVQKLDVSQYASGLYFLSLNFISSKDGKERTMSKKFQVIS
ncbi:MAG: hypothetical protein JWO06_3835 [Bacteroidota bacterium]|nr:hypothetical protein [Bacteroidota bacterium]